MQKKLIIPALMGAAAAMGGLNPTQRLETQLHQQKLRRKKNRSSGDALGGWQPKKERNKKGKSR